MSSKRWWQKYVPGHAKNPIKMAWQLLTDKKPAARSALFMAAAGVAATPLDLMFSRRERQIYANSDSPRQPIILVCGPPRSGTTLVAQFLINHLEVGYINNLTSLFPRSPIYANRVFGTRLADARGDYDAYYGKSRGLSGVNDALYLWDRWLGSDRSIVPDQLVEGSSEQIGAFFGALEALNGLPTINKVNRLNTCAHLVARELPVAQFICVRRDPLFLAQSLYVARTQILGDQSSPYGVHHQPRSEDPIEDVCLQVQFHEEQAKRQEELVGRDRFVSISYEGFCAEPNRALEQLVEKQPTLEYRKGINPNAEPFSISRSRRIPPDLIEQMKRSLQDKGLSISLD